MTTRSQKAWRLCIVEYAKRTTDEDLSEIAHSRPPEEAVGALELVAMGLATAWVRAGYPQEEVERAFTTATQPSVDLDASWKELSEWPQAEAQVSKQFQGKVFNVLQALGGMAALLGFALFLVNSAVVLFDGPAKTIAWLAPTLLIFGLIVLILAASTLDRLRRRHHQQNLSVSTVKNDR
ncbi:hypothetical protein [Brevundimonas sp.]